MLHTVIVAIAAMCVGSSELLAQRCAGELRFRLFDPSLPGSPGSPIVFDAPSSPAIRADRIVGGEGVYDMRCRLIDGRPGRIGFWKLSDTGVVRCLYGCGGTAELTISRRHRALENGADTMRIVLVNACDAAFGADITYVPGAFHVMVCDTTSTTRPGAGPGPSLNERYPGARHGGRDLTEMLRKLTRPFAPVVPSRSLRFLVTDADGIPLSDAVVRGAGADSARLPVARRIEEGLFLGTIHGAAPLTISITSNGFLADTIPLPRNEAFRQNEDLIRARLARPGDTYEVRGGRRYAYTPRLDLIAIVPRYGDTSLGKLLDSLDLRSVPGGGPFILVRSKTPRDPMNSPELAALRRSPGVAAAGTVRSWSSDRIVVFSDRIHLVAGNGLKPRDVLRAVPGISSIEPDSGNGAYIATVAPEVGEGITEIAHRLMSLPGVGDVVIEYLNTPGHIHAAP